MPHFAVQVLCDLAPIDMLVTGRHLQLECSCHVVREQLYQALPARWLSQRIAQRTIGACTKAADGEDGGGGRNGDSHAGEDGVQPVEG